MVRMTTSETSKPTQASGQNGAGGGYKDVTATAFNEEVELKGGNGFEAAKVYAVGP